MQHFVICQINGCFFFEITQKLQNLIILKTGSKTPSNFLIRHLIDRSIIYIKRDPNL